jgi:hypothetical protein
LAYIGDENANSRSRLPLTERNSAMSERHHFEQTSPLSDRLKIVSEALKAKAAALQSGPERDAVLRKARQAETATHLNDWANSSGLQPPK